MKFKSIFGHLRRKEPLFFLTMIGLILFVTTAQTKTDSEISDEHLARQNYYERLGVTPTASRKEIKDAYAKFRHRNIKAINANDPAIHLRTRLMTEAFNQLKNTESRAKYNAAMGFSTRGLTPERNHFLSREKTEAEFFENFGSAFSPKRSLTEEAEKTIEKLDRLGTSGLTGEDLKFVLTLFDDSNLDPRVVDRLANALSRNGTWPSEVWEKIESRFTELRHGQPLSNLLTSIQSQENWPPSFRSRVEAVVGPGVVDANALNAAENLRVTAVKLLVSRKEKPSAKLLSTLESFLSAHHNSDLFRRAELALEKIAGIDRTEKMDELIVQAMRNTFYNDASKIPSRGPYPNTLVRMLLKSQSLPKNLWPMLLNELSKGSNHNGALSAISLLAQKYDVPVDVSEQFFRRMAEEKESWKLPQTFSDPQSFNFFDLPKKTPRIDLYHCETVTCLEHVLKLARSSIDSYKNSNPMMANLLLSLIQRAVEENPKLLDTPSIENQIARLLKNSLPELASSRGSLAASVERLQATRTEMNQLMRDISKPKPLDASVPNASLKPPELPSESPQGERFSLGKFCAQKFATFEAKLKPRPRQ